PADAEYEVLETLSFVSLTTPGVVELEEGDEFDATARIYANGVSQDDVNNNRVTTWIGVNETDGDPAQWPESAWELMEFAGEENGYFVYSSEVAYRRSISTYYVAVRSELDVEATVKYGGLNGFWDDDSNPNAVLTISEQAPFRYTLVEWNFDNESIQPSFSLPQNDGATIETVGAEMNGFSAGAGGFSLNSNSWAAEDSIPKYWMITLSTENLENILLSSKQYGSGTGPRDFVLQVSLDSENWADVPGGEIEVGTNWTTGVVEQLSLPALVDNQPTVYVRWLLNSDERIDPDSDDPIASGGTSRIDDIIITGINPAPQRVEVWPGDTNSDGIVDETDVLGLTTNWLARGPQAIYDIVTWEERPVELWIPPEATYADANGDGIVNQNDLFPIGLNFGSSVSETKSQDKIISFLSVERLKSGEDLEIFILSEDEIDLTGISFNVLVSGVDPNSWQLRSMEPVEWADDWIANQKLLDFKRKSDDSVSGAFAYRGLVEPRMTSRLVKIRIEAISDWQGSPSIQLNRFSVANGREIHSIDNVFISLDETGNITQPISFIPERTELLPNYPNPFNPSTTIQYKLSNDSNVTVDIYNSIGRRVATLVNQEQNAGEYNVTFDASSFSSGIYFYRLQTNEYVRTRSMVLVK
uniref:T9SS type A sorting domain-containing protein n=1 Tax=Rhodohalobacter halophilus TaxID=1812810 RepID=UPI00114C87B5